MDNSKIKIKRYEMNKCKNCESLKVVFVGWFGREGYYCESCNLYCGDNGEERIVKRISIPGKRYQNQLFKSDLRFKG